MVKLSNNSTIQQLDCFHRQHWASFGLGRTPDQNAALEAARRATEGQITLVYSKTEFDELFAKLTATVSGVEGSALTLLKQVKDALDALPGKLFQSRHRLKCCNS